MGCTYGRLPLAWFVLSFDTDRFLSSVIAAADMVGWGGDRVAWS